MLNFDVLWHGLRPASPSHFVYDFSRKILPMLYSINRPSYIVWLSLLLEILGNVCITFICLTICDVMNFEINLCLLIKPFSKKSGQKVKYLKNEKNF